MSSSLSTPPSSNEPENVGWALLQPGAYAFYSTMLGVAQETLMYPLDVIKTRQQHDVSPRTRSGRDIFRELWHTEGVRGLYRGYLANSVGSWPGQVVYFGGYEFCKHTLGQLTGLPTEDSEDVQGTGSSPRDSLRRAFVSLTSGCVAETIALLIHQPADIISQRQMVATYRREVDRVDLRRDIRAHDIIRAVVRHEGWRGFYRGYFASVMTYSPASAVWFCAYDMTKPALKRLRPYLRGRVGQPATRQVGASWRTGEHLVSGAVAGLFASLLSNPLDVARTRQMCMDIQNPHDAAVLRRGFFYIILWTAQQEGVRGLFRGLWMRLLVTVPGSAVTFASYEIVKRLSMRTEDSHSA